MALTSEEFMEEARYLTSQRDLFKIALEQRNEEYAALERELAECRDGKPNPPDPPHAGVTTYGSCPRTGRNATGEPGQFFGTPADVRWFGVPITAIPPRPSKANCGLFLASCKPFGSPTPTKSQFLAWCKPLLPGDGITWEHEYDVKYLNAISAADKAFADGQITAAERDRRKAQAEVDLQRRLELIEICHEMKEELRPDLFTYPTTAGWRYTTDNGMAKFKAVGDYAGIDFDGVNTSYYNFANPTILKRAKDYADANHDGNIIVPEWGWPRQANDPTGAGRAKAINDQTPVIVSTLKPRAVVWFDSDSFPGYPLTLANERSAWSSFVDKNAA